MLTLEQAQMSEPSRRNAKATQRATWLRHCLHKVGGSASWTWPMCSKTADSRAETEPLLQHLCDAPLELPDGAEISLSSIQTDSGEIIVYRWVPPQARGWIVLLHGYLLHSLCQASCIAFLLQQGYAVIAPDWPGHGLSEGNRASIDSFQDYADVLDSVMQMHACHFPSPPHLIAHSTGASAWLEYQRTRCADPFARIVLVAPLLRNQLWHLSCLGIRLASPWLSSVPRCFRKSSSDPDFLNRMHADPLAPWSLPLQWSRAQMQWVAQFADAPINERSLWVLQGDRDNVVDWRFGLRRITAQFPQAHIQLWPGQKHDLLNEARPARDEIFRQLLKILADPEPAVPTR
ncbi:MAG: alpha/beta hydrolase [Puniceicoccaceae bacterium]